MDTALLPLCSLPHRTGAIPSDRSSVIRESLLKNRRDANRLLPNAAASRVRSHEQEHVSNAYKDAAKNNGKVMSCNVAIKTSVCPECGRTYVAGGTTSTQIKYFNEENPYQKEMKSSDAANKYLGMNVDLAC